MSAKEILIERRHRDLTATRNRLPKKDRHGFHRTTRVLLKLHQDFDLIEDGEVVARCSDIGRLEEFIRRQE